PAADGVRLLELLGEPSSGVLSQSPDGGFSPPSGLHLSRLHRCAHSSPSSPLLVVILAGFRSSRRLWSFTGPVANAIAQPILLAMAMTPSLSSSVRSPTLGALTDSIPKTTPAALTGTEMKVL